MCQRVAVNVVPTGIFSNHLLADLSLAAGLNT